MFVCQFAAAHIDVKYNLYKYSWPCVHCLCSVVNSFVDLAKYLLSQGEDGLFLLSERISQDPLENYFGQQRARGGRNENPNVQQCIHNAAALRVQKSMALDPVRGNSSRKINLFKDPPSLADTDLTPLPKRARKHSMTKN